MTQQEIEERITSIKERCADAVKDDCIYELTFEIEDVYVIMKSLESINKINESLKKHENILDKKCVHRSEMLKEDFSVCGKLEFKAESSGMDYVIDLFEDFLNELQEVTE